MDIERGLAMCKTQPIHCTISSVIKQYFNLEVLKAIYNYLNTCLSYTTNQIMVLKNAVFASMPTLGCVKAVWDEAGG